VLIVEEQGERRREGVGERQRKEGKGQKGMERVETEVLP